MLRYFIPDRKIGIEQVNPALWADLGLSHAATQWPALNVLQSEGPGGALGTVVVFHDADRPAGRAEVGYFPDKQDWVKCGKYWCGRGKDEVITPESLRLPDAIGGYALRLGDGQEWEIAKALYSDGITRMPRKLTLNDDGAVIRGAVLSQYAVFDAMAMDFFRMWVGALDSGLEPEWSYDKMVDLAVLGLQVNYRISKEEAVRVLGLIDETNMWEACLATISWQKYREMRDDASDSEKKN